MKLLSLLFFWACVALGSSVDVGLRMANRGETASKNEFPYQVAIRIKLQGRTTAKLVCGGSLISDKHVLTAAHCIEPMIIHNDYEAFDNLVVEVGSHHLGAGKSYSVKRASYHKEYTTDPTRFFPNDIAVLHLTEPVELSDSVAIINLPKANSELPDGTIVIASGFGTYDANVDYESPILRKMDARTISIAQCTNALEVTLQSMLPTIESNKMCAVKGTGYGVCKGDSGGPLVDSNKKTIVGVVSGGDTQCSNGSPDVYTKVSRFIDYINEELSYDSDNPTSNNQNPAMDSNNSNNMVLPPVYQQIQQHFPQYLFSENSYPPNFWYPQNVYPGLSLQPAATIMLPQHPIYYYSSRLRARNTQRP